MVCGARGTTADAHGRWQRGLFLIQDESDSLSLTVPVTTAQVSDRTTNEMLVRAAPPPSCVHWQQLLSSDVSSGAVMSPLSSDDSPDARAFFAALPSP